MAELHDRIRNAEGSDPRMSADLDDFDLDAAWVRRAQGDLASFMEAFAARLHGAAPDRVTLERRRDGLLARSSHVAEIVFRGESAQYRLIFHKGQLRAEKAKLVRGVVISTGELTFAAWLAEVRAEAKALAGALGAASEAMGGFL